MLSTNLRAVAVAALILAMGTVAHAGSSSYRSVVLADNPIVYYELDEATGTSAANSGSSGAAHDGTIGGVVTLGQASFLPQAGTAYDFDGGWITVAGAPSSLTEWTVEAWMNWNATKRSASHFFGNDISGWNDDVLLGIGVETGSAGVPAGYVGCVQQGAPGSTRDAVKEPLSHSKWHHVVATGSTTDGELKLYVDGVLVDTDSSPVNGLTLNGIGGIGSPSLFVGKDGYANRTFKGLIDEFALYGTVLDATAIDAHYQAGLLPTVLLAGRDESIGKRIVEGPPAGSLVGTLSMIGTNDWTMPVTYSITGGNADGDFALGGTPGSNQTNLLTAAVLNADTHGPYNLEITATDSAGTPGTAMATFAITVDPPSGPWFRGNTHTHTTQSDGDSSPEVVTAWYHDAGYNFLVLTDHNKLVDPATVTLPNPCREDFILIPGEEVTGSKYIHTTGMNVDTLVPWGFDHADVSAIIEDHVHGVLQAQGLPILNHPNFRYAVTADDMLAVDDLHLFELINGHPSVHNHGDASHPSTEEMWDHMLSHGKRIFAVAADDAHHLQSIGPAYANPGRGWIMVKANELTPDAITRAVRAGDFYASNGVILRTCDASWRAYVVEADISATEEETQGAPDHGKVITAGAPGWTISFIGQGGTVLSAVQGTQATFRPLLEHGYVRARVTYRVEDGSGQLREYAAWGQPVFAERGMMIYVR